MEKLKIGNTVFELVPNGADDTASGLLTLRFQPGDLTVDAVEALLLDFDNTERIRVLESDGTTVQQVLIGYVHLQRAGKVKDYVIETKTIPAEQEGEDPTQEEITADIIEAVLAKTDVQARVDALDGIVNAMLGVTE